MSKTVYPSSRFMPFLMWFIPLVFFAHQFILRLWPGLMMQHIIDQFSIDATLFGALAASYYYGYAGMQIPVALLLDRYGARIIISLFALLSGFATLAFIYTDNFYIALISRFCVGAGSAAGFLGVSKVVSEWFDKKIYSRMIGLSFSVGLLGAVYGGKPVGLLMEQYPWTDVVLALGFLSIAMGCAAYLFLRSPATPLESQEESLSFSSLKSILSSKVIWVIASANLLLVGVLEGFADIWGVSYLAAAYDIIRSDAAGLTSCIFLGMVVGGPLLAAASDKFGEYITITLCGIGMGLIFTLLLCNMISLTWVPYTLFAAGIMCCYQISIFTLGSKLVSHKNIGICVAFLNSINMFGGSFFHTAIGLSMDALWNGSLDAEGARFYELESYHYALSIIPICSIIGALHFILLSFKQRRTQAA